MLFKQDGRKMNEVLSDKIENQLELSSAKLSRAKFGRVWINLILVWILGFGLGYSYFQLLQLCCLEEIMKLLMSTPQEKFHNLAFPTIPVGRVAGRVIHLVLKKFSQKNVLIQKKICLKKCILQKTRLLQIVVNLRYFMLSQFQPRLRTL